MNMLSYLSKRNSSSIDKVIIITLEDWMRLVFHNEYNVS